MCVTLGVCCEGEMQYTDNVLLMMLEQEVAELKEAASRQMGALSGKKGGISLELPIHQDKDDKG